MSERGGGKKPVATGVAAETRVAIGSGRRSKIKIEIKTKITITIKISVEIKDGGRPGNATPADRDQAGGGASV